MAPLRSVACMAAAMCSITACSAAIVHNSEPAKVSGRAGATLYKANDPRLTWTGRKIPALSGSGGYTIDWENTMVAATIKDATYVAVAISDSSENGARFAVYYNNTNQPGASIANSHAGVELAVGGDPNPSADAVPNFRILTFLTMTGTSIQYPLATRTTIANETATYTVRLLTEPQFIRDYATDQVLTIEGIVTDGVLLQGPPKAARRIEILGDSLTAGYGSGFELSGSATCGASMLINDVANSYGAVLCTNFSADCNIEAVSGITLMTGSPNLPNLWDFELGSMYHEWKTDRIPYNASEFVPDAVIINLGENDANGNCFNEPSCIPKFTAAYVDFVQHITGTYANATNQWPNDKSISFFLTIAPHEKGQSVGILPAVSQLTGLGYKAYFLNATVDEALYPHGCGGHPGPTIHAAAAARAQPVIAQAMGWE